MAKLEDGQERFEREQVAIRNEMRDQRTEMRDQFNEIKLLLKEKDVERDKRDEGQDKRILELEQGAYRQKYFIAGAIAAVSFVLEALRRFFNI